MIIIYIDAYRCLLMIIIYIDAYRCVLMIIIRFLCFSLMFKKIDRLWHAFIITLKNNY